MQKKIIQNVLMRDVVRFRKQKNQLEKTCI